MPAPLVRALVPAAIPLTSGTTRDHGRDVTAAWGDLEYRGGPERLPPQDDDAPRVDAGRWQPPRRSPRCSRRADQSSRPVGAVCHPNSPKPGSRRRTRPGRVRRNAARTAPDPTFGSGEPCAITTTGRLPSVSNGESWKPAPRRRIWFRPESKRSEIAPRGSVVCAVPLMPAPPLRSGHRPRAPTRRARPVRPLSYPAGSLAVHLVLVQEVVELLCAGPTSAYVLDRVRRRRRCRRASPAPTVARVCRPRTRRSTAPGIRRTGTAWGVACAKPWKNQDRRYRIEHPLVPSGQVVVRALMKSGSKKRR